MKPSLELRGPRAGFTIVEVVVAMGLFLLGMASILGLLTFGAAMTRTAALRSDAASAVEAVVADLEESLFPMTVEGGTVTVGPPRTIAARPLPGRPDVSYSATATPDPSQRDHLGGALEYRVDVTLTWSTGGESKQTKFTTLMTREIQFSERLRRQFVEKE